MKHGLGNPMARWRLWSGLWLGSVVLLIVLADGQFAGHSHWSTVNWIPFRDAMLRRRYLADVLGNVGLFVPFGFCYARGYRLSRSTMLWHVALISGLCSLAIEFYQVFCHGRSPSMTDVVTNLLGGLTGGAWSCIQDFLNPLRGRAEEPDQGW